jgi:hypothetical protein
MHIVARSAGHGEARVIVAFAILFSIFLSILLWRRSVCFGFLRFGFDKLSRACRFVDSLVRAYRVVIDAFTGHLC